MATYLIGYDLNRTGQDYKDLIDSIKTNFDTWWHHLDSTWIVITTINSVQIRDLLTPHIDSNDELLVVRLTGEGAWYGINERGSDWLIDNLGK